MAHTSGNILLHFIFSTSGRRPLIKPDFRADLFAYLGGILRELQGQRWSSTARPITFMRWFAFGPPSWRRKSRESWKRTRRNGSVRNRTQSLPGKPDTDYSASANQTSRQWQDYVAGQEEHHQKQTFQEEFATFLKKNNAAYDEKYIGD